ncbi:BofC C-terminal domain-containing protein [Pseudalkalibacillus salsuginis]|uniref:BofC C-terminal domain-containing protein n=1 Tax=Pseudalkalibacillus salsuginis TaxID=2910972 RepID=UPI001F483FD9|nr:intercompartmental signaling factor BofC [Pseudalkalibacillus salsuginis]MCF6408645.1 intercompartmental signaling factor BofC [Pseudalkalibacillus salsuginis]
MKAFSMKTAWVFPLVVTVLGAVYVLLFHSFEDEVKANLPSQVQTGSPKAQTVSGPLTVEVLLQRTYLDGESSQEVIYETIWSMDDFWAAYADWQLVDQDLSRIIFEQEIDDISPLLKVNGYFGLTEDGILTIFNGRPHEDQVIQSFYQIDVHKLESNLLKKLREGIRVETKTNYQEVINQYKPYAIKE